MPIRQSRRRLTPLTNSWISAPGSIDVTRLREPALIRGGDQMRMIASRYAEIANTRRVGGQGEVFQATDLHQGGRMVPVKLLPGTADDIYRIYFERSTAANRKLNHPNIAALLDNGVDASVRSYYLV